MASCVSCPGIQEGVPGFPADRQAPAAAFSSSLEGMAARGLLGKGEEPRQALARQLSPQHSGCGAFTKKFFYCFRLFSTLKTDPFQK